MNQELFGLFPRGIRPLNVEYHAMASDLQPGSLFKSRIATNEERGEKRFAIAIRIRFTANRPYLELKPQDPLPHGRGD